MASEFEIRDRLARHLEILEPGLTLIETEHPLRNPIGAKGSVDILARDYFGHRVIIELKRSDVAARSALHELFKYVALFKAQHGIPAHQLRCFLVSTEWHELLVPFGEFVRTSAVQAEGFLLHVAPDGTPTRATKVEPQSAPLEVTLFHHHDILLFEDATRRDLAATPLADQLYRAGVEAAFVCRLDCTAQAQEVPYPYALYAVVGGLDPVTRRNLEDDLRADYKTDDLESLSDTLVEESFSSRNINVPGHQHDTYEIGYPDKLTGLLRGEWHCLEIHRRGRMADLAAATDTELLDAFQGVGGQNTILYQRLATPRVPDSWAHFRRAADKCLRGNPIWENDFALFCDLVERQAPHGTVAASIYNPLCLPLSLFKLIAREDPRYLPTMEVICSDTAKEATVLLSSLVWDGRKCVESLDDLFHGIVDGAQEYFVFRHLGGAWEIDDALRERLGLQYQSIVLKTSLVGFRTFALSREDNAISLVEATPLNVESLNTFIAEHHDLLFALCNEIGSTSQGI